MFDKAKCQREVADGIREAFKEQKAQVMYELKKIWEENTQKRLNALKFKPVEKP